MSDKFMVTVACPHCGVDMKFHRAKLNNWIHKCRACHECFMVSEVPD